MKGDKVGSPVFFSRSQAITAALRKGLKAFHTFRPVPDVDKMCWTFKEQPVGPGIEYARMWAEDKDWIFVCEVDDKCIPILVVSCFREEIIEAIPELFRVEPLTPELWEKNRDTYPKPAAARRYRHIPNPPHPPIIPDPITPQIGPQPIRANNGNAGPAPVAQGGLNGATGAHKQNGKSNGRSGGAKAICREVYLSMPGAAKKDVIDACIARGVFKGTAAARYTDIRREVDGQ